MSNTPEAIERWIRARGGVLDGEGGSGLLGAAGPRKRKGRAGSLGWVRSGLSFLFWVWAGSSFLIIFPISISNSNSNQMNSNLNLNSL